MRELTQEEIDLAPDWATHYYLDVCGDIWFQSNIKQVYMMGFQLLKERGAPYGISSRAKPIPRKAFDLSGYEFSDSDVSRVVVTKGIAYVYTSIEKSGVDFKKADIITIAKALGVTGDDLLERARGEA